MEFWIFVAFFVLGALAGLVAGLLGLSGGVIIVPSLVLIYHLAGFPQAYVMHSAVGTSLAATMLNSIAAVWAHHKRGSVVWGVVLSSAPGIFLGCLLGAYLAHFLSSVVLQMLYGLFVILLGAYVLLHKKETQKRAQHLNGVFFTWSGLGTGTLASTLGIGGGIFTVPLLISQRYPPTKAIGTSSAMGFLMTFLASIAYLYFGMGQIDLPWHLGYIYLPAFAIIGLTAIFFAQKGAKWAHAIDSRRLKKIFAATLILTGILMIFH